MRNTSKKIAHIHKQQTLIGTHNSFVKHLFVTEEYILHSQASLLML
jgi:hypothetical protein